MVHQSQPDGYVDHRTNVHAPPGWKAQRDRIAALEAERDALRAEVEKWKFAVLERYPISMEFDCTNPGLMI